LEEKAERLAKEKAKRAKDREELRQRLKQRAEKDWRKTKAKHERDKKRMEKMESANPIKAGRAAGGKLAQTGTFSSTDGDMDVAVHGSVDVKTQKPASNNVHGDQQAKADIATGVSEEPNEPPTRLRSFSGEEFSMGGDVAEAQASTAELPNEPPLPTPGNPGEISPRQREATSAESLVSSLDEVMKVADENGEANKICKTSALPYVQADKEEKPPTPTVRLDGKDVVTDVKPLPIRPSLSQPAHVTSVQHSDIAQAETGNPQNNHDKPQRHHQRNGLIHKSVKSLSEGRSASPSRAQVHEDGQSDTDSFPDFDWQTDLDMSSADDSVDENSSLPPPPPPRTVPPPPIDSAKDDGGADEPWNAVCVVGLRVYSLLKHDQVTLKVIKPKEVNEDKRKVESIARDVAEGKIDPDDMNKGAVTAEPQGTGMVVVSDTTA